MKRLIAGMTAALLAVILFFSVPSYGVSAKSAILLDCTTGRVLYGKNIEPKNLGTIEGFTYIAQTVKKLLKG